MHPDGRVVDGGRVCVPLVLGLKLRLRPRLPTYLSRALFVWLLLSTVSSELQLASFLVVHIEATSWARVEGCNAVIPKTYPDVVDRIASYLDM
ncbi:hypothetical protein LX36DRAFT_298915 [Colletotrichum falcatum]|nr:hypothetical protein LX36DRAFT_298915 [Colletotrichum falcatum]